MGKNELAEQVKMVAQLYTGIVRDQQLDSLDSCLRAADIVHADLRKSIDLLKPHAQMVLDSATKSNICGFFSPSGKSLGGAYYSAPLFVAFNPEEPHLTKTLGWYMNPDNDHGFGDHIARAFLHAILTASSFDEITEVKDKIERATLISCQTEFHVTKPWDRLPGMPAEMSRIASGTPEMDIVLSYMSGNKPHLLVVECKFGAGLADSQVTAYTAWAAAHKQACANLDIRIVVLGRKAAYNVAQDKEELERWRIANAELQPSFNGLWRQWQNEQPTWYEVLTKFEERLYDVMLKRSSLHCERIKGLLRNLWIKGVFGGDI